MMNYVPALLNLIEYNHLPLFHISTPFWLRQRQYISVTWCISSIRNPKDQMEHDLLGQNGTSVEQNGTIWYGPKWHTLTNAYASNLLGMFWWIHFRTFSEEGVRECLISMLPWLFVWTIVWTSRKLFSHVNLGGKMTHNVPFYPNVGTKW